MTEVYMKTTRMLTAAALIVGSGLALHVAQSQQPGVTRTDLLRHDLSVSGREVIHVRADLAPGVAFPRTAIRDHRGRASEQLVRMFCVRTISLRLHG
jgi:hypothetical protein